MTRDEAIAEIQEGLGFRKTFTASIIRHLKTVQILAEQRPTLPRFLISEITSRETVVNEERVPFPTDFLREFEDDALYIMLDGEEDREIKKRLNRDEMKRRWPGTGVPQEYTADGKYFRLAPIPNAIYRLRHTYYKQDVVLDSNIENLWLKYAPEVLIGWAGELMASNLRDAAAVEIFRGRKNAGLLGIGVSTLAQENAAVSLKMGDPD